MGKTMLRRQNSSREGTKARDQGWKSLRKTGTRGLMGTWRTQREVGCDGLWVLGQDVQRMGNHCQIQSKNHSDLLLSNNTPAALEDGLEVSKAGERSIRRTIQSLVYDKADSGHLIFCGKEGTSLSEITGM